MKIYFTASLRGKKDFGENYIRIIKALEELGNKVYSEHITSHDSANVEQQSKEESQKIYGRLITEIKKSELFVAEVSSQSLSVGHEITEAISLSKPVIVMYTGENRPGLLFGADYDKLQIVKYELGDIRKLLAVAIAEARKRADVRFNFFVSPKILSYLDWVAKNKMIPRSVFLRDLIEKEMKKDKGFKL